MDEKINILPFNGSNDTATAMAMMNNNPWMLLANNFANTKSTTVSGS